MADTEHLHDLDFPAEKQMEVLLTDRHIVCTLEVSDAMC